MTTQANYITSDIGIAAYLQLKGFNLVKCLRLSNGRFHFEFEQLEDCKATALEFLGSEFCKFDNNVRNLKKVIFS